MSSRVRSRARVLASLSALATVLALIGVAGPAQGVSGGGAGVPTGGTRAPGRPRSARRDRHRDRPAAVAGPGVELRTNLASATNGAAATGAGDRLGALIDDTEATNWESAGSPVADKAVIVNLEGTEPHDIGTVQVSALLFAGQNRFTALRRFAIQTCTAVAPTDCTVSSNFTTVFTSSANAFPSVRPRPRAPDLIIRAFDLTGPGPEPSATHVRFVVLTNQCTGGPDYQGDQDNDPINITDCSAGSVQDLTVRAAELQVFAP